MAYGKKEGIGAVFWATFIIFGLLVLIGIFYWMVAKPNPVRHSPEKPNGAVLIVPPRSHRTQLLSSGIVSLSWE
jgi:hypothetical protein